MNAYLDASVLLRLVLKQANALAQWSRIASSVASSLTEVECLRAFDRLRLSARYPDDIIANLREAIFRLLEATEIIELTHPVLARAAQPLPTALGTLDAIHLSCALLWKEHTGKDITMATHDAALAVAARASGLRVIGV